MEKELNNNMKEIKDYLARLITVQHASHELNCSVSTIYNKIKNESLSSEVIDGVTFVVKNW